jgi:sugar lactone lactonase YvrE
MIKKFTTLIYLAAVMAGGVGVSPASAQDGDYTKGFFVLNEDWYGHQNSTINWMTDDGEWYYRVFKYENPGQELGCTAQYGTVYADRLYIIAKQDRDPGASVTGGRVTVCDAASLKCISQISGIGLAPASNGNSYHVDGRAFVGWNSAKGYISTSNGVWSFDLNSNTVIDSIPGTTHNAIGYDRLYTHQCGSMVRAAGRIFVAHQQKGLLVIDPETDTLLTTIVPPEEVAYNSDGSEEEVGGSLFEGNWNHQTSFGSVVLAKDGYLYCSVSDKDGMGGRMNYLVRIDPDTYETKCIELWNRFGCYGPANSWYAWTPDGFCASTRENVLYWNGGEDSWFSASRIYRYDIDKDECSLFLDFTPTTRRLYGCSFRIDPVTDHAILTLQEKPDVNNPMDFSNPVFLLQEYDNSGNLVAEHDMIQNYWFPSIPIFIDRYEPENLIAEDIHHDGGETFSIDMSTLFRDADDMVSAMRFSVLTESNPGLFSYRFSHGQLILTPEELTGTTDLTIEADSRGRIVAANVRIVQTDDSGVDEVMSESPDEIYYDLAGRRLSNPEGAHIVVARGKKILTKTSK